jgi:hypothetical protein
VSENRVLRRIFVSKGDEIVGCRKKCIMKNFIAYIPHQLSLKSKRMRWRGM